MKMILKKNLVLKFWEKIWLFFLYIISDKKKDLYDIKSQISGDAIKKRNFKITYFLTMKLGWK